MLRFISHAYSEPYESWYDYDIFLGSEVIYELSHPLNDQNIYLFQKLIDGFLKVSIKIIFHLNNSISSGAFL